MPKISVKNADDESNDKLSVEELNSRLKKNFDEPSEEPDSSESEDEEWLEKFPDEPDEPGENEDSSEQESDTKDEELDKAVEDIEKSDSDELLESADEKLAKDNRPVKPKGIKAKISHYFKAWWNNKLARNLTFAAVGVLLLAFLIVPNLRYFALNTFGVRASASLLVVDQTTSQPLKNVSVSVGGQEAKSNEEGRVFLSEVKLGPTELVISKTAFAEVEQPLTIGLGSNPLGEYKLTAVGAQYKFVVTDWLSGKPVDKAEAVSGESNALGNQNGEVVLTVEETDSEVITVQIKLDKYRTENLEINTDDKSTHKVSLVPSRKHLFISKRSGKFDLYKIDVDGKDEKVLVAGTGQERDDDMALVPNYKGESAALVSTREGTRNKEGYLLNSLFIVNVNDGSLKKITTSERIQPLDWIDDRLIYVTIAEGASASNPKRHRLMSYNLEAGTNKEIAATNYFNDVLIAAGKIYYAPSNAYNIDPANARLFVVDADGSNKKTILAQEVWNVLRTAYGDLAIATSNDWYNYKLGEAAPTKLSGPPPQQRNRLYIDNDQKSKSIWIDSRDGKGVILEFDIKTNIEKSLLAKAGVKSPHLWLSDSYIIYRVDSDSETADYVISNQGGEPKKIKDVSGIGGIDNWYYY